MVETSALCLHTGTSDYETRWKPSGTASVTNISALMMRLSFPSGKRDSLIQKWHCCFPAVDFTLPATLQQKLDLFPVIPDFQRLSSMCSSIIVQSSGPQTRGCLRITWGGLSSSSSELYYQVTYEQNPWLVWQASAIVMQGFCAGSELAEWGPIATVIFFWFRTPVVS